MNLPKLAVFDQRPDAVLPEHITNKRRVIARIRGYNG
jgi:hypothetical protein